MNYYWRIFLAVIVAAILWKGGEAVYHLYGYYRLTAHTEAQILDWSVEKQSEERYIPKAHYQFKVGDQIFSNEHLFLDRHSLNPWASEQDIKQLSHEKFQVWYAARNPSFSALQKNFPLKECLSAAALIALFLYFIWLGNYVTSYGPHPPSK